MEFVQDLKRLGLKDKEAAVYLASLQLGPSPAQQIARKARVVRATTYVILESLMKMGLVTQFKEGKKTLFSAEPPRQLMRLLEKQNEEIKEKTHELELLLPELQVLMKSAGGRPSVRFFEGREGLHAMRQEILMYMKSGEIIFNFTPADHLNAVFPDDKETFLKQRIAKKITAKTLFTTRSTRLKERWLEYGDDPHTESRYVEPDQFPVTSGMTIFGDRIAIGNFVGSPYGVVVESQAMADTMRNLFTLAWEGADKVSLQK